MTSPSGIVLAGGRSSRMGRPKALLEFDGAPLIAHVVGTLRAVVGDVVVVAAPDQELPPLPATVVHDEVAYRGPVAGIHRGLVAAAGDVAYVTSCDAVFMNRALIRLTLSRIDGYDVAVPHWEARFQPLHAAYRRSVIPHLAQQLAAGDLRPVHLFDKVRTRRIEEDEIRAVDPQGWHFFNMNTPEDHERALELWPRLHDCDGPVQRRPRSESGPYRREHQVSRGVAQPATRAGRAGGLARRSGAKAGPSLAPGVRCTVEMLGVAQLLSGTKEVVLDLPQGATIADALCALADRLPVLVGRVVHPDRGRLVDGYACSLNAIGVVRDRATRVTDGDCIVLLAADAGG